LQLPFASNLHGSFFISLTYFMPKRFFFSTFWIAFDFSLRFSSSLPRACAASEG
jgi:hypothetical protein